MSEEERSRSCVEVSMLDSTVRSGMKTKEGQNPLHFKIKK